MDEQTNKQVCDAKCHLNMMIIVLACFLTWRPTTTTNPSQEMPTPDESMMIIYDNYDHYDHLRRKGGGAAAALVQMKKTGRKKT